MTTPVDNPSFLARFVILATIVAITYQLLTGFFAPIKSKGEAAVFLILLPALFFAVLAGIYYLFKGKPSGADKIAYEEHIIPAWGFSLFVAVFSVLLFY